MILFREPFERKSPNPGLPIDLNGEVYYEDFPFDPPQCGPVDFPVCPALLVGRQHPLEFADLTVHTGRFFIALMGGEDHMKANGVVTLIEDEHYWYGEFVPRKSTKEFCRRIMLRHTTQSGRKDDLHLSAFELAGYKQALQVPSIWRFQKAMRCAISGTEFHRCLHTLTNVSLAPSVF